jgi:hypothetical protein
MYANKSGLFVSVRRRSRHYGYAGHSWEKEDPFVVSNLFAMLNRKTVLRPVTASR